MKPINLLKTCSMSLFAVVFLSACGEEESKPVGDEITIEPKASSEKKAVEPKSIDDIVSMINALPKPLTLKSFLEALPHPLTIDGTSSQESLQPAKGADNPRIFIITNASSKNPLFMSIQLEGDQSHALELGEVTSTSHQLGNIEFPVTKTLVRKEVITSSCGSSGCHMSGEYRQPDPAFRVDANEISNIKSRCKAGTTRCDVLNALFKQTSPNSYVFPKNFR